MKSEHELQKKIISYLKEREHLFKDIYYIRNNTFVGQVLRPDGSKGWVNNNKPGAPDIIFCHKGCFIGIEIKAPKGKQNPLQKLAEQAIRSSGGQYFVVRTEEEFMKIMDILS